MRGKLALTGLVTCWEVVSAMRQESVFLDEDALA